MLTPRGLRARAVVLALCLRGVCVADSATSGQSHRDGNIKIQDFLPLSVSAREAQITHLPANLGLPNLYGPQICLLFVPLSRFRFLAAALLWSGLSVPIYGCSIYLLLRPCPSLLRHSGIVAIAAITFPPLVHFFLRGHLSALALACFIAAFLAFVPPPRVPWLFFLLYATFVLPLLGPLSRCTHT